ncbi:MAG TPA: efflux RND transporter periplasmic adaptor subunit [Bryobacteraceae bacterium]|nr:efflux RND transporter periplasmic adaptor subunit [Bryobacteraceae bacterium]
MKRKWKIVLAVVVLLLLVGGVAAGVKWSQKDLVVVQTGLAAKADLTSIVTASGEIKPRNYINIGANAQGRITQLLVKEGDHVRKDQVVARIEHIQAAADVNAQKAAVASAQADSAAAEASVKSQDDAIVTAAASVEKSKSELARAKMLLDRAELLQQHQLIAKQEYDTRVADYRSAQATLREDEARLAQAKSQRAQYAAQLSSYQRRIAQTEAGLARISDVLAKFDAVAPIDGVVTNLPVREGETVVPGVQNSAASTIMTIADMSLITAEVKVDETDIVNVQLGQSVAVKIDAMPDKSFDGKVIEIGNTAILRSSGLAASQSTTSSQEAKDFKVVVALTNPPGDIRPGLSCNAKITTATRRNVLTIPIQALTMRTKGDLEPPKTGVQAATVAPNDKSLKEEIQGVFVVKNGHAEFHKVETGITGATDIEVISGLNDGDQIITGSYKVIRTIRNAATVKVDNRIPVLDVKS